MTETGRGHFITLEGGEGTGKSTLARALADRLADEGIDTVMTREPGGTPLAEAARQLLLHPPEGEVWSALSEALLVNAARRDHIEKLIRPALAAGKWVICDRFADSTRVYQSIDGGVEEDTLRAFESAVLGPTVPDLTLVLDVPMDVARARRAVRTGTPDSFERRPETFHEAVKAAFLGIVLAEPERCRLIDASLSPDEVADAAWREVSVLLAAPAGRTP